MEWISASGIWVLTEWPTLMLYIGIPAFSIAAASEHKRLKRVPYLISVTGTSAAVAATVFLMLSEKPSSAFEAKLGAFFLIGLVISAYVLFHLWSVYRTQDIGMSRWWNLLLLVPLIQIPWWLFLLVKKGSDQLVRPG